MKEATGELNASLLVFIAVSLLSAFFFMVVWPNIKGDLKSSASCANAVCKNSYNDKGLSSCTTYIKNKKVDLECPFKG